MNDDYAKALRSQLVHDVERDTRPGRTSPLRRAAITGGALVAVMASAAFGAAAADGDLLGGPPGDRVASNETDFVVAYELVGSAEVSLPSVPANQIVASTITCHDAGSLDVGGYEEPRDCEAGESFTFPVELSDDLAWLPVGSDDETMRWSFTLRYTIDADAEQPTTVPDDRPSLLPQDEDPDQ